MTLDLNAGMSDEDVARIRARGPRPLHPGEDPDPMELSTVDHLFGAGIALYRTLRWVAQVPTRLLSRH